MNSSFHPITNSNGEHQILNNSIEVDMTEIHGKNLSQSESTKNLTGLEDPSLIEDFKASLVRGRDDTVNLLKEIRYECFPPANQFDSEKAKDALSKLPLQLRSLIHIPFIPALHRPGWLLKLIVGPYDEIWVENIFKDLWAGITVALLLIPQGLSLATLANLQPVQGLYAAVLPSVAYVFLGTALQLAAGPTAIVALLVGEVVATYVPNFSNPAFFDDATAIATQLALTVGIMMMVMSLVNLGSLIQFISRPVFSGFTSGCACVIALNQFRNGFGFAIRTPQQGQPDYPYNHLVLQWYLDNWYGRFSFTPAQLAPPRPGAPESAFLRYNRNNLNNGELYRNVISTEILFAVYFTIMAVQILRWRYKETPSRRRSMIFRTWAVLSPLVPFMCLIVSAFIVREIKRADGYTDPYFRREHEYNAYNLRIVGVVPSGLGFLTAPSLKYPFSEVFVSAIPLAFVAYMESYAVSRQIGSERGELTILHASQELFANGVMNVCAACSSAFPVCGSFSRSSLNHASGAKTLLSKITTLFVVLLALQFLTNTFFYIPQAALAAIIWAAVWNLISVTDAWNAWKRNKQDFLVLITTWVVTLVASTQFALVAGVGLSLLILIKDAAYSENTAPILLQKAEDNDGIDVLVLQQELNFVTCGRAKDKIVSLTLTSPELPHENAHFRERIVLAVASVLDYFLIHQRCAYVKQVPKAIIIDFSFVTSIDWTGLTFIKEALVEVRRTGALVVIINARPAVERDLVLGGVENDCSNESVNVDEYLKRGGDITQRKLPDFQGGIRVEGSDELEEKKISV